MNYESLRKYKVGIYIKFRHMLRGKIFERNEEIGIGGQICPLPVYLGLNTLNLVRFKNLLLGKKIFLILNTY